MAGGGHANNLAGGWAAGARRPLTAKLNTSALLDTTLCEMTSGALHRGLVTLDTLRLFLPASSMRCARGGGGGGCKGAMSKPRIMICETAI